MSKILLFAIQKNVNGQLETAKEELNTFDNKIDKHAQFKARNQQVQQ